MEQLSIEVTFTCITKSALFWNILKVQKLPCTLCKFFWFAEIYCSLSSRSNFDMPV